MTALIHKISATEFAALDPDARLAFMADIAAEWIDAGEDGEFAMPDSYSRLFERRVKQLAALNKIEPGDEAMSLVIERAANLYDTGEIAYLPLAADDEEISDEPDVEEAPKPRRRRAPKAETPEPVTPPQPDVPVPTEPMPEVPQVEDSEPQEGTQPPEDPKPDGERHGVWVESLLGESDHGPYDDEVSASLAMDDLGLSDDYYKMVVYDVDQPPTEGSLLP